MFDLHKAMNLQAYAKCKIAQPMQGTIFKEKTRKSFDKSSQNKK